MAGLTRTVHPHANIAWKKLVELAPDLSVNVEPTGNGTEPEQPMGLALIDPDGETHIYVFTEEGRVNLIRQLTGGLIVPKGI